MIRNITFRRPYFVLGQPAALHMMAELSVTQYCPQTLYPVKLCLQDLDTVVARKKRRSVNKSNVRPIGNASIEVLQKRRAEKPEQRKASREAALR